MGVFLLLIRKLPYYKNKIIKSSINYVAFCLTHTKIIVWLQL